MSRETGTAIDANDLIEKIRSFLQANNYIIKRNEYISGANNPSNGKILSVEKNDKFFHLRSFIDSCNVNNDTNYVSSRFKYSGLMINASLEYVENPQYWHKHPGSSSKHAYLPTENEILAYDFICYENPNIIAIMLENRAGERVFAVFGEYDSYLSDAIFFTSNVAHKIVTTTTQSSLYYDAVDRKERHLFTTDNSSSSTYSYIKKDDYEGWANLISSPTTKKSICSSVFAKKDTKIPCFNSTNTSYIQGYLSNSVNEDFSLPMLLPINMYVSYKNQYSLFANVPNIFIVNMKNLENGQILTYGNDQYIVYAMYKKDWNARYFHYDFSYGCGYAFKIN